MRRSVITVLLLSVFAVAGDSYQTGTLIDITHQDSSRIIGSTQDGNGSVTSVTDREYNISVKVGDMTYVGSYWPRFRWSYEPTDFVVNSEVKVRLTKKEMFLLRGDRKELKTRIIKRISASPLSSATSPH